MGKVFYFRPGHETYPTYYDENVRKVIANAARWAAPTLVSQFTRSANGPTAPLEKMEGGLVKDASLHGLKA
jgi:trehalose utilization protein